MFNLFKKKTNSANKKETYIFGDTSSQYGFFISYRKNDDTITLYECTLFDRETYEEYSAYKTIPSKSFLSLLRKIERGEKNVSDLEVTIIGENGIVKEIKFYGIGSSGNATGSGIINENAKSLIKKINLER